MRTSQFGVVSLAASVLPAACGQAASSDASQSGGQAQAVKLDFSGLHRVAE